ncbi:MAG: ABC transporter substrate-binding protein [Solirubrobacterales bacterium]|nr:ABC transporter substrate-binding protein [Solirubrobacterales bacterium]
MPLRALCSALAAALLLAGCGGPAGDARPDRDATLLLDFAPNAVHAGVYLALEREYDDAEGVRLTVRPPGSSTDATKLLLAGRAQAAILDIHDLALARARGRDVVGVLAIVQTPLAAVLAQPGVRRPRDLEGRRVGVTGLPSDDAVLDSIVRGDGGDPRRVRRTTIGFDAVPALLAGRVAGATGFWNAEGTALRARRPGIREFRVEAYGAPAYPELVLCVARTTLQDAPAFVRALVRALRRGYEVAVQDPDVAVTALTDAEPELDRAEVARELDAVAPSFTEGVARFGELDPARLRAWASWERRFGIVEEAPDVAQAFSVATSRASD